MSPFFPVVVYGDVEFGENSALLFNVSDAGWDRLEIHGHAVFAGTIAVNMIGGFVPDISEEFEIITFDSSEGAFETEFVDLGGGLQFVVDARTNDIVLVVEEA